MTERLTLVEIEVPFRRALQTVAGPVNSRRSVLVGAESDGITGWGEAPAFPSGRFGTTAAAIEDLTAPSGWEDDLPTVPIARAAVEAARADAAARREGLALHTWLGADGRAVTARHPIGLLDADAVDAETAWIEAHGITAVKLKIAPGRDALPVAALRASLPHLDIGVDGNATYTDPADPVFAALAEAGVSFVEQPFAVDDLEAHRALRGATAMSVCLDESIVSEQAARRALEAEAADIISVKLNRHGLNSFRKILGEAARHGIAVRIGGTFDTSIGRRHLLAASGMPGVVDAAVGPPGAYLSADVAPYPPVDDGKVSPDPAPGIGVVPDPVSLDAVELKRLTVP